MKRAFHHGNLKEACIEVGLQLISEGGVDNLSLRDVARKLGVSHGAPYKHFGSKEILVAAISEKGFEMFGQHLVQAAMVPAETPYQKLANIGHAYLDFALKNPDYYRLLNSNVLSDVTRHPNVMEKALETYQFMQDLLAEYDKAGFLNIDDVYSATIHTLSQIHGYCSLVVENRFQMLQLGEDTYHEQLEKSLQLLWKSLA